MPEIGKYTILKVVKQLDFGVYLDGGSLGEILLPIKQVPPGTNIDDPLEVFLYRDSEDRIIATTRIPFCQAGEFAVLRVLEVNKTGAWLDWGLEKHLLAPFREQKQNMEQGKYYLVYVYVDRESKRLVASSKLQKFLDNVPPEYEVGQEVDLIISNQSDIGYLAVINNMHTGLLYKNEVFQPLNRGQHIKGYIKKVREDLKIDLILQKPGYEKIESISDQVLLKLRSEAGYIPIGDKSSPEEIYSTFGISKKDFKKAVGKLFKEKKISISDHEMRLL